MTQFLQQYQQKLVKLAQENNLTYLGLFGSAARNDDGKDSDIDLLYDYNRPMGLFEAAKIQLNIQQALGKKVDFISRKYLKPRFKQEIEKDLIRIYEKS